MHYKLHNFKQWPDNTWFQSFKKKLLINKLITIFLISPVHLSQLQTCLILAISPFSAYTLRRDRYVSGPGSIPAPFITDRMPSALSMSLHKQVSQHMCAKQTEKAKSMALSTHPARAWPVTRELNTASVMGRSLLFIKPRIVLQEVVI